MFPDKQKRLINVIVPVTACNMRCQYCYVSQMGANSGKVTKLPFDVETVAKAFSVERLGGKCLLQLCGNGETLIPPYIVKLVRLFLEDGHYVFITTNGTLTNKIDAMLQFPQELRERLGFKFSYHYLELKRLGKLDVFFENAKKIHAAHSSELLMTAHLLWMKCGTDVIRKWVLFHMQRIFMTVILILID